jgi:hypothetical protein
MKFVTARHLQREFHLPKALAREITGEQTRHALRHRWQPWVWLACWLLPALACWFGLLPWHAGLSAHAAGVCLMIVAMDGWIAIACVLAGPAMRVAARSKARRLGLLDEERASTWNGAP